MATVSKGKTFGATEEVTAAKLHQLVDSATVTGILAADIANTTITDTQIASVGGAKFITLANIPSGAGVIPATNLPADNVKLTGDQTIAGTKTFSSMPIIPSCYRGDATDYDYNETGSKTVLNTDGTWRDLDLSTVVPNGAREVLLSVSLIDDVYGSILRFRKNGDSNTYNVSDIATQVANVQICADLIVYCDTNRVIEYYGSNVAFTSIRITIKGWRF
jgi:hypothetical protein